MTILKSGTGEAYRRRTEVAARLRRQKAPAPSWRAFMTGLRFFHPEASADLDEIWEFIAADNLECCR